MRVPGFVRAGTAITSGRYGCATSTGSRWTPHRPSSNQQDRLSTAPPLMAGDRTATPEQQNRAVERRAGPRHQRPSRSNGRPAPESIGSPVLARPAGWSTARRSPKKVATTRCQLLTFQLHPAAAAELPPPVMLRTALPRVTLALISRTALPSLTISRDAAVG